MELQLEHLYGSCFGKWRDRENMYQMVLNTTFMIDQLVPQSKIKITREKVSFSMEHSYDRFFCSCEEAHLLYELHTIADWDLLCERARTVDTKHEGKESLLEYLKEGHILGVTFFSFLSSWDWRHKEYLSHGGTLFSFGA